MHENVKSSDGCLDCHDPVEPEAPPTQHKELSDCLKCHNDELDTSAWLDHPLGAVRHHKLAGLRNLPGRFSAIDDLQNGGN